MKLVAFNYGTTEINGDMAFENGDKNVKIPISLLFFLIEYKDKKILVDVGCDTMPGFELFTFQKPVEVLESYGISRTEITDVVITHSHHDHIDAVYNYPQAIIHIHENELKYAKKYLDKNKKISAFNNDFKIADNVEVKLIGGHSFGSCIVLIDVPDKTLVLCGDECYTKENLIDNIPTGCYILKEMSKKFVKEYRKEKYTPILFHDSDILNEIGFRILYEN